MTIRENQDRHWVSRSPFNPQSIEELTKEQERFFMACQWTLIWWKLRRHPLAVVSMIFLAVVYISIIIFCYYIIYTFCPLSICIC